MDKGQTIEQLRKIGRDGLEQPWHSRGEAEQTIREARMARLDDGRAIIDAAKAADRGLLASEQRRFDGLMAEADELDGLSQRFEAESRLRAIAPAHIDVRGEGRSAARGSELRTMGEALITAGAVLVPDQQFGQVWEHLSAQTVLVAAGARVIETDRASLTIPKLTADSAASWVGESDEISESSPTMGGIVATLDKCAALVRVSNELISDSNPSVLEMIMGQLTRSLSLALDLAGFEGTGTSNQPRGLSLTGGITTITDLGADGSVPTDLDEIATAVSAIEADNGKPSAIFMHPELWGVYMKVKTDTAATRNEPLIGAGNVADAQQRRLFGLPVYLSSQLSRTEVRGNSSTCSSIFVCDMSQIVLVRNGTMRLELDKSRRFNYDESEIRGVIRATFAFPNPAAIARIVGAKVS